MREICRGLRFPEGPIAMDDGSVLLVEIARGTLTRVGADGGVDVVAELGGGPNGAALGPDGRVYVCNNGGFQWHEVDGYLRPGEAPEDYRGGSIQVVDPATGDFDTLYTQCGDHRLRGPNDIVFDEHGGFWFTDLGKRRGWTVDRGAVFYAAPDGGSIEMVVDNIMTPNGIGLSPDGDRLYVAETGAGRVWWWAVDGPGRLAPPESAFAPGNLLRSFEGIERLDSLAVDSEGNVVVATLVTGCVTAIAPDGSLRAVLPVPEHDPMVTNVCFGGDDLRTAYITSSGTGRLYAASWHCPGLRLHWAA